jgi:DNA replication protein DnaC
MSLEPDLVALLKRLKLGQMIPTLPDRLALARAQKLDYAAFLTLILADEVQRRDSLALERRLLAAGFEERVTLEHFDWSTAVQLDRRHLNELFSLHFLAKKEHVLFIGPVGVGKTFLAQALGAAATRAGKSVLFRRADYLLRELGQARADHSLEVAFRRYLVPDLLSLDDFGLHRLTQQESEDFYALIIERHRRSSFIVTSNRDVSEWVGLFADPILANSALDRLAHGAHQLVIGRPQLPRQTGPASTPGDAYALTIATTIEGGSMLVAITGSNLAAFATVHASTGVECRWARSRFSGSPSGERGRADPAEFSCGWPGLQSP